MSTVVRPPVTDSVNSRSPGPDDTLASTSSNSHVGGVSGSRRLRRTPSTSSRKRRWFLAATRRPGLDTHPLRRTPPTWPWRNFTGAAPGAARLGASAPCVAPPPWRPGG
eukprot:TRINITY_DN2846_c0_g1_i1.p2 TRINITY_DN2846_c0_g1~~TRINITY_DN2846_c0_g1_i1.p2  ORF type:complete len:109 (+),score=16.85 TRINITY_DN2846_c0_g1_i1:686-1012(+)